MIERITLIKIMKEIKKILGKHFEVKSNMTECCAGCQRTDKEKYFIAKTWKSGMNKSDNFYKFKSMYFMHNGINKELFIKISEMVKEKFNLQMIWDGNENTCIQLLKEVK